MLALGLVNTNPIGTDAITWIGVIILALLAAVIVALWVFLFSGRARNDDDAPDPALEGLRRRRLVVRRPRKASGPEAVVVSELDPASESEPAAR